MNLFIILTIIICIFMYYLNNKKEQFENSANTYSKVYISFTTIPSRIAYIDEMLRSVDIPEVYEIHLNLQSEYDYPEKEIERLKSITPKLKVFWSTEKLLLMSKVVPTLERLLGTNALVISVDDDMVYSRNFILEFIKNYDPNIREILGGKLGTLDGSYEACKIENALPGLYGIMYPMRVITKEIINDLKKSGKLSESCYRTDDLVTPIILRKYGIGIRKANKIMPEIKELDYSKIDAYRNMSHPPEYSSSYNYNDIQCCNAVYKYLLV